MKATGIIRHIDDLGRIVIPKEIRRTLGIKDGDPMEISTDAAVIMGCIAVWMVVRMDVVLVERGRW